MQRLNDEERRARVGLRHRLAAEARTDDVTETVNEIVALHATDPASVFLSAGARLSNPKVIDIEAALYEQRTLVRLLAMRRTMFVVPSDKVSVMDAACGQLVAQRERRVLLKLLEDSGIADTAAWLARVEASTLEALRSRGEASGKDLSDAVPELRTSYTYGEGKKWGGTQTITTRLLNLLSVEGLIVRGRPGGTWASGQYRWTTMESWLPDAHQEILSPDEARVRLIRAWLRAFGPATIDDIKWWTGLTVGQVSKALTTIRPVEVDMGGMVGLLLADDLAQVRPPEPWTALLPALDPTPMGWVNRGWYLSDEARAVLFDRSGNIGPTIWSNGRIVGGWAQRKGGGSDGEIVYRLFEDIGSDLAAQVEAAADGLQAWHGAIRVTPRFRTPLERELVA